ncbi:hypothetical protein Msi02_00990 [Microbispora siamensis]|uniref:Uncharacterized protein n=1 Tax=Microbispora siamensis TaxID=564413 RepID=A0ABQ4GCX4_9ACTN|nr:hypothetical protein Msi02_00990 [Microbispora siamensis]
MVLFCDRTETAPTPGAGVTEQVTAPAGWATKTTEAAAAIMVTAAAAPTRLLDVVIASSPWRCVTTHPPTIGDQAGIGSG